MTFKIRKSMELQQHTSHLSELEMINSQKNEQSASLYINWRIESKYNLIITIH